MLPIQSTPPPSLRRDPRRAGAKRWRVKVKCISRCAERWERADIRERLHEAQRWSVVVEVVGVAGCCHPPLGSAET
eukprot:scaffold267480_cov36-Tisochrysis_lutea.AAC.1